MRFAAVLFGVLLAGFAGAAADVVVQPRVGADFEHFGDTYQVTDDHDTVSVINDYGTLVGVTVRSPYRLPSRFRLDADVHLGKETQRFRTDFEGRLARGANVFELEQETTWRMFRDGGDYSISSDHLWGRTHLAWERELSESFRLRLQDRFDGTWYASPDSLNLNQWTNEPRVEGRFRFHGFDEATLGARFARRSVPDSSSLGYRRYGIDSGLSLLFGWTGALDLGHQLERRRYDAGSVRESSWESRFDARFEFAVGDRATMRLIHENEIVRFDDPGDLDFDSEWARTGFEFEVHRTESLDLSVMPVYAFLQSPTSAEEEYTEAGLEMGVDFRLGNGTFISITDEVGRRDYEISAEPTVIDTTAAGDLESLLADLATLPTAYSDYLYNRLTVLVTAELFQRVSANFFLNWQPEDHHLNRHDRNTRIVSGGIEYAF